MALPPLPIQDEKDESGPPDWLVRLLSHPALQRGSSHYASGQPGPVPGTVFQPSPWRYPDRMGTWGSDLYPVKPGDSWGSIAIEIYGDEAARSQLMLANPNITSLHPGMHLVLPDKAEDPRVPTGLIEIWNQPEFADLINNTTEIRERLEQYREAEMLWPEHGEPIFLGFDENNDPFPTTDARGLPAYWDPETEQIVPHDTGIRYTMGMVENDFIRPLSDILKPEYDEQGMAVFTDEQLELQRQLTMAGESLRPEALEYYQQQHLRRQQFGMEIKISDQTLDELGIEDADRYYPLPITDQTGSDTAYIPTLHGDRVPRRMEMQWWERFGDFISLWTEEGFRGASNWMIRELASEREGLSYIERGAGLLSAWGQLLGTSVASAWHGFRLAIVRDLGFQKGLRPYAIDAKTGTRLSPVEVNQRIERGLEHTIRYMSVHDYYGLEMDRAAEFALRWTASTFDGHLTGIYKDDFETEEDYEDYLAWLLGVYGGEASEEKRQETIDWVLAREAIAQEYTQKEAEALSGQLMSDAFAAQEAGDGELALSLMQRALRLKNQAAVWYSPYFMWSESLEPWRYEKFLLGAATATLAHGEELEDYVVRDLRRQYENGALDIMMGVVFDTTFFLGGISKMSKGVLAIGHFLDLVKPRVLSGILNVSEWLGKTRVGKPIIEFMQWLASESHASVGTTINRLANNLAFAASRAVDNTLGQPGVRGLDQVLEDIAEYVRLGADPSISDIKLPGNLTERHVQIAKRLISMFDSASDEAAMGLIHPERWGELVNIAYRQVWNEEYLRHQDELMAMLKGTVSDAEINARAARFADDTVTNPQLVARRFGSFFEEAWRASKKGLGPQTLEDNVIYRAIKAVWGEEALQKAGLRGTYSLFYTVRNFLFEWWLGLRPAWTAINFIDSNVRALISGAKLFDDVGWLAFVDRKVILDRNLLREEFLSTFTRGLLDQAEDVIRVEPAIDRMLRGKSFKWGPFSVLADAFSTSKRELKRLRKTSPPTGVGKVFRWITDSLTIAKRMASRGFTDMNQLIEFGLRTRVYNEHLQRALKPLDIINLERLRAVMLDAGYTTEARAAMAKLWALSGDDAGRLEELVRRATEVDDLLGPLHSELVPDNFSRLTDDIGLDRRTRTLILNPIVDELENIVRTAGGNADLASREIVKYIDEVAIPAVNDEFIRAAENLGAQPTRVDGPQQGVSAVSPGEAQTVNLGAAGEELLVTTEQLRIGRGEIGKLSPQYHDAGKAQSLSWAETSDHITTYKQASKDAAAAGDDAAKTANWDNVVLLTETREQLTKFRDATKNWLLRVFPGPLLYDSGPLRRNAWDSFDRLGTQIYTSITDMMDEMVEGLAAGRAMEIPSLENMLKASGIDVFFVGQEFAAVRVNDLARGTLSSFSGFRATNWVKRQLLWGFFGSNANFRHAYEVMRMPYTPDLVASAARHFEGLSETEKAIAAFAEPIGAVVQEAMRNQDEAWKAFIRNPDHGAGQSILEMFGYRGTATRADFIDTLESIITEQSALVGDIEARHLAGELTRDQADRLIQGVVDSTDMIQLWQREIQQIGLTLDSITNPDRLMDIGTRFTAPPQWLLDDGIQTFLRQQRGLAAQRHALIRALKELRDYAAGGISDGSIKLTGSTLSDIAKRELAEIAEDAVWLKATQYNLAADGSTDIIKGLRAEADVLPEEFVNNRIEIVEDMIRRIGGTGDEFEGAVARTQFDMLEYGKTNRLDQNIKFLSPFWMFQSRSPLFWLRTFANHPEFLSWHEKYSRQQRLSQFKEGAVSSSGMPLNRMFGYWRIPHTTQWVAPLNGISSRYVLPRPTPYPRGFAEGTSAAEIGINYIYEYGRMFGVNPAPWITLPLYFSGILDENRVPQGTIISHIDLVPPFLQRDIRRMLRMERFPGDPGKFTLDVGWQDFLIQKEMLGQALLELEETPDSSAKIKAELYEALGYELPETDEYGRITDLRTEAPPLQPFRDHPRWVAARNRVEGGAYWNQLLGFFTGIYPKEMTDAEAALIQLQDEINFLQDSINSAVGHVVFALDPVAESRYESYMEKVWESDEGFIDALFSSIRWTQLPGGVQAYGDDRNRIIAERLWENEVTAAYHDSMGLLIDKYNADLKDIPIGADSALRRAAYGEFVQGIKALDDEPAFEAAKKYWSYGYKTDKMIMDRFRNRWWGYVAATRPHWFQEDGELYTNWLQREQEWLEDLEMIGAEMAAAFLAEEVYSRAEEDLSIPGDRVIIPQNVINQLMSETSLEGWEAWKLEDDDAFDAMNAGWRELRWDPYMEASDTWQSLNVYDKEQAQREWKAKFGGPPTADELMRWVHENYPDRFTTEELLGVFQEHGVSSVDEKLLPNNPVGVVQDEVWEMLMAIGPGENFKVFEEALIRMDPDLKDTLDAWYEVGGHFKDYEQMQVLHAALQDLTSALGVQPPSTEQLMEWGDAKELNDVFREGVEDKLGSGFWTILATYGSLRGNAKKDYKEEFKETIDVYFEMRDFFAEENQLWAKYYHIDMYKGGVGLPGEGAEKREEFGADVGGTGGRGSGYRRRSTGGRATSAAGDAFIPQGYRSTHTVSELFDPNKLGSGGMGGQPFWPPGWGRGKPRELLTEVIKLIEDDEPLSAPAQEYLDRQEDAYSEAVLKYHSEVSNVQQARSKGFDTTIFSR